MNYWLNEKKNKEVIIHRLKQAPDRTVYYVNITPKDAAKFIEKVKNNFKKTK